jgi:hypothetical protein
VAPGCSPEGSPNLPRPSGYDNPAHTGGACAAQFPTRGTRCRHFEHERRLAVHEAKALIEAQSAPPPDAQRKSLCDRGEAPSEFLRNLCADRL